MEEKSCGQVLARGFAQAIPWAVVFSAALLVTFSLMMGMVRQEIKEAIDYTAHSALHQAIREVLNDQAFNDRLLPKIKQNAKEAIEYTVTMAHRKPTASTECKGCRMK